MLNHVRSLASYHLQAASNSLNSLCRKPLSTTLTVLVIAIALTLPALFWVISDNLERLTTNWQQGSRLTLYLKANLTTTEQSKFIDELRAVEGVAKVDLKSADESLAELQQQEGMHDIMRFLPENPLPALIEITPTASFINTSKLEQLSAQLKAYPQVEQAKVDMEWVNRLNAIFSFVRKMAHALMILLASAVVLIVGNSLRLAVHNRFEEIQVLKLIGATDFFIIRPFLYSGIWYSLAGAILAVLFVNIFMLSLTVSIKHLAIVYQMHSPIMGLSVKQAYLIVFFSTILGWIGARLAVKKQLASIEPYN